MGHESIDEYLSNFEEWQNNNPEHRATLELFARIADESPRGMVLVVAAELDRLLLLSLHSILKSGVGLDGLNQDNQGPISTFSARTNLAHALGIVNDQEHRDLTLIRRIRNAFAHEANVDFDSGSVKHRVNELSQSSPNNTVAESIEQTAMFLILQLQAGIEGAKIMLFQSSLGYTVRILNEFSAAVSTAKKNRRVI